MDLRLSVNYETELTLPFGMPLIFTISVSNPEAREAAELLIRHPDLFEQAPEKLAAYEIKKAGYSLGSDLNPWYEKLELLSFREEETKAELLTTDRLPPVPWDKIQLHGDTTAFLYLGKDPFFGPEDIQHTYMAVYLFVDEQGLVDTIRSNTIKVRFVTPGVRQPEDHDNDQLFFAAKYWLRKGECEKARPLAERYLDNNGEAYAAFSLDGQIRECLGDDEGALRSYHEAYQKFDQEKYYEFPVFLLKKIHELQEKMIREHSGKQ